MEEVGFEVFLFLYIEGMGFVFGVLVNEVFGEVVIIWVEGFDGGNVGDVEFCVYWGYIEE